MNKLISKITMGTMLIAMVTVAAPTTNVDAATKSCNKVQKVTISNCNQLNNLSNCTQKELNDILNSCNNGSKNSIVSSNCNSAKKNTKTFSCGKLNYQVTGANTVTCTGLNAKSKNTKSCTIPSTVTCNGKTYKVNGVKANAFANCSNLSKINCKAKLASKGKNCFGGVKVCK